MRTWTATNPVWGGLSPVERVAAMALMEADRMDPLSARNAAAAMINRAYMEGQDIGAHVSRPIYQPTFEPAQEARLRSILASGAYRDLIPWVERRHAGAEPDPVDGATHFLAHPSVMLALEARNPNKYRSWRGWSGFDPVTGRYGNATVTDASHVFVAPGGRYASKPADSVDPALAHARPGDDGMPAMRAAALMGSAPDDAMTLARAVIPGGFGAPVTSPGSVTVAGSSGPLPAATAYPPAPGRPIAAPSPRPLPVARGEPDPMSAALAGQGDPRPARPVPMMPMARAHQLPGVQQVQWTPQPTQFWRA